MSEAKDDAITVDGGSFNKFVLVICSLFLGNGALTFYGTADRYYGEAAASDFALRDAEIAHLEKAIFALQAEVKAQRHAHPPPNVRAALDALDERLREMELEEAKRQ